MTLDRPTRQSMAGNAAGSGDTDQDSLVLGHFIPYRLSVLTNIVSRNLARVYADRFRLTVPEWRVLAVLGANPGISANEVAEKSAMDKVMVSRAVDRLVRAKRLDRRQDTADRRRSILEMSAEGKRIYDEIVPLALDYERDLLAALPARDLQRLDQILTRLQDRALALQPETGEAQAEPEGV
ncbi:MarR family winged helix-turn-helix transcriptional regulator [Oceanibacterium hippocampi]|uniref:Transcriptional regulator HosA n=1 Tax=Oceanibacterium hippocampi TaxID=745714 RepID=A0A1Y5SVR9_9PROT|nr:MarR family winged helix-turn-helix transcriptional regulator [Oceanibacterium hippocampi]SLN48907.1 Transcriptional regulator HosA [Oceanibacterium hippocampi]